MTWDEYYFGIAKAVAAKSSCLRAKVGCIIVKDKHIISTGFNGAPKGRTSCAEKGFCYRDNSNIASGTLLEACAASGAHAELNAIVNAAKHSIGVGGGIMYLVGHDSCCVMCQSAVLNSGIVCVNLEKRDGSRVKYTVQEDFKKHPILDKESLDD